MSAEPPIVQGRPTPSPDTEVEENTGCKRFKYSLCDKCSDLRLDEVLGGDDPKLGKIAEVGTHYRQAADSECSLCIMLSHSRLKIEGLADKSEELHTIQFLQHFDMFNHPCRKKERRKLIEGSNALYLALVPSGFYSPWKQTHLIERGQQKGFLVVRRNGSLPLDAFAANVVSAQFDASLPKEWLRYCQCYHQQLCSSPARPTIGLRLIDCHSLTVTSAPTRLPYVALSYVWGLPTADQLTDSENRHLSDGTVLLPSVLPATIADAIKVAVDMGFRYLWIDKHCIDQKNKAIKHDQIKQMDTIYRNADLTIIAAAGPDPHYGLAGVTIRPRNVQPSISIGGIEILSTMRPPRFAVESSTWSKRAWTFQEAVLSCRRLVFTDDQVYFECNAMNCYESVVGNMDVLHTEDRSRFTDTLRAGFLSRSKKQEYGLFDDRYLSPLDSLIRYMVLVETYTARELTYDTDSLNAFSGIIRKFEDGSTKELVYQIWGIPFLYAVAKAGTRASFADGLAWSHKINTQGDSKRPRRRPDFPSWSWAGWAGEVEYAERTSAYREFRWRIKSVSLELDDGSIHDLSVHVKAEQRKLANCSSPLIIRIQAISLPRSSFSCHLSATSSCNELTVFGYRTKVALSTGPEDPLILCEMLTGSGSWKCISIGVLGGSVDRKSVV